jgi:hypothetical protein
VRRWEDNIKVDLQEVWYGGWTGLIWLRIGTRGGSCEFGTEPSGSIICGTWDISWLTEELLAPQEGFSMELVDTLQETKHVNRACFANASCLSTVVFEHELFESECQKQQAMEE